MATKPRFFNSAFYYHIYNRGVEKREIFQSGSDYHRFLETIKFYLHDQGLCYAAFSRLSPEDKEFYFENQAKAEHPADLETSRVKLLCYCLMPNHFHLLLKPVRKNGITVSLSDICNSYARYFNTKNSRQGSLFQGAFRAKIIDSSESLIQASRYIHLNPLFSWQTNPNRTLTNPKDYPYSSYNEFLYCDQPKIVDRKEADFWLKEWGEPAGYEEFVKSKIDYNQLAPEERPNWFID